MGLVLGIVSLVLLLMQVLLIARAVLDWSVVLAGPTAHGSVRSRLITGVHAVTEPILAPVRRALPPAAPRRHGHRPRVHRGLPRDRGPARRHRLSHPACPGVAWPAPGTCFGGALRGMGPCMRRLLARLEGACSLDRAADRVRSLAAGTVGRGRLGDLLHGMPIGHPLHPAVVQFPVGAWMSAAVLDLLPGTRHAATALLAAGTAGALPAAMTGAADYATLSREQRRVALVHAAANTVALGLFAASVAARLRGRHDRGRALSFAGLGVAGASAYLGGHLAFGQGAGVNHSATALQLLPHGWHRLGATDAIPDGQVSTRMLGDPDRGVPAARPVHRLRRPVRP